MKLSNLVSRILALPFFTSNEKIHALPTIEIIDVE